MTFDGEDGIVRDELGQRRVCGYSGGDDPRQAFEAFDNSVNEDVALPIFRVSGRSKIHMHGHELNRLQNVIHPPACSPNPGDGMRHHSYLSATSGSRRDARRAGRYDATTETLTSSNSTTAKVSGSVGSTAYSKLSRKRVKPSAPATPKRIPIAVTRRP